MLKLGGKDVHYLRLVIGITRGRLSPLSYRLDTITTQFSGQAGFIHYLSHQFILLFSPPKYCFSPLVEHYFYPVSTAPTINPTKRNLKER